MQINYLYVSDFPFKTFRKLLQCAETIWNFIEISQEVGTLEKVPSVGEMLIHFVELHVHIGRIWTSEKHNRMHWITHVALIKRDEYSLLQCVGEP